MTELKEFRSRFERLISAIRTLEIRLLELEEFERQWEELFNLLKEKTGHDCKVSIINHDAYRTFRWDRYHVLINDLHSVIVNELGNEHAVLGQSIKFLVIEPEEAYQEPNPRITFLYPADYPNEAKDEARRRLEISQHNARTLRGHCISAMKSLFPTISGTKPVAADLQELKSRFVQMKKITNSARQVFAHKHEELATRNHMVGLERANLAQLRTTMNQLAEVVHNIGFVAFLTQYSSIERTDARHVSDQIDLILFGSMTSIVRRIYAGGSTAEPYQTARKAFYESDEILSVVAHSVNPSGNETPV